MRAGKLDRTITIQRFATTLDEFRTPVKAWTDVATVRAQLVQSSTEEFMKGFGEQSQSAVIFRIRYLDGITPADRVSYDGRIFDLKEIRELGRRDGIDLRCMAAVA